MRIENQQTLAKGSFSQHLETGQQGEGGGISGLTSMFPNWLHPRRRKALHNL